MSILYRYGPREPFSTVVYKGWLHRTILNFTTLTTPAVKGENHPPLHNLFELIYTLLPVFSEQTTRQL